MQASNALDPQSPQSRAIYDLAIPSTIIFALIFVIVTGAITYAVLRFRGAQTASRGHSHSVALRDDRSSLHPYCTLDRVAQKTSPFLKCRRLNS